MDKEVMVLIICFVPEIAKEMNRVSKYVEESFKKFIEKNKKTHSIISIVEKNRTKTLDGLNLMARFLTNPNKVGFVYYFGHGDQVKDLDGDEIDRMDEKWVTQNILDDEISKIFLPINEMSRLYLFSDSCSSGSMIDQAWNRKNWVTISSANDRQDSLATSDGGAFTIWGLIPSMENLSNPTADELFQLIKKNIDLPTQTTTINSGNPNVRGARIF
jgi:hypothetical protein